MLRKLAALLVAAAIALVQVRHAKRPATRTDDEHMTQSIG
jgi:hypothetical protein